MHLARHLGHANPQMHLGRSRHADPVEQRLLLAEETLAELAQLLRLDRRVDRAVEHDAAVDRGWPERGCRAPADRSPRAEPDRLCSTDDHGAQQDLIVLVDRVEAGRAGPPTEQIDDAGRLGLDIGDLGVGDEHGSRRAGQADHLALAHLDPRACRRCRAPRARPGHGAGVASSPSSKRQADAQDMPRCARSEAPAPAAKRIGDHQLAPCWS